MLRERGDVMDLIQRLKLERDGQLHGGIYDITQKRFAYNSNKIEGSRLTEEQTSQIWETKSIANIGNQGIKIDDLVESANHFKCFDYILDTVNAPVTEEYIKKLHSILKSGTSSETNPITPVGRYKVVDNEVGSIATVPVEYTEEAMIGLLMGYDMAKTKDLARIASFHANFERIHPFADGNGRVGRLIAFKECLNHGLIPFIVDDDNKLKYYKALAKSQESDDPSYLKDYFKTEQKFYENYLKNKGFVGKINETRNGAVISKKSDAFYEKLNFYRNNQPSTKTKKTEKNNTKHL